MEEDAEIQRAISAYISQRASLFFLLLTKDGTIAVANEYANDIVGRRLVGASIRDIIIDFSRELDLATLLEDAPEERLLNIDCTSGLPQSFYFTFKALSEHILAFGRLDVEELGSMRKEMMSLNSELSNLTRQLHQKNAQLGRLNEEKNRFLGMAAHDLRKPIGLVTAYSEFLIEEAEGVLEAEHMTFLQTINSSSTFMKRLVDDFLDVSAIEAGKFELDLALASIYDVLARSLELNNLQAGKKGVELRIQRAENLPRLLMDASKLEQVMVNLVSNAIEHTKPNSIVVVSIDCDAEDLMFSVEDEGPGIPLEEQDNLFKPFGKTSVKKTGGEKSTGLGMLITRKIVEAHDGRIWVDSSVGKGTTVFFTLPIRFLDV